MLKENAMHICSAIVLAIVLCTVVAAQEFSPTAAEVAEWRLKADQGDAEAQYNMGRVYRGWQKSYPIRERKGWRDSGVAADHDMTLYWWRKAADQGHLSAQYSLGTAYRDPDRGNSPDWNEAVRWYRKAADRGYAPAQYELGDAYSGDKEREAVYWWRKAAWQGHVDAQKSLGDAYLHGVGTIMDEREAYIWLSMARANGAYFSDEFEAKFEKIDLSESKIHSARKEATLRLKATNYCKQESYGAFYRIANWFSCAVAKAIW